MQNLEIGKSAKLGACLILLWGIIHIAFGIQGIRAFLSGDLQSQWAMFLGGANGKLEDFQFAKDGISGVIQSRVLINFSLSLGAYGILALLVSWAIWKHGSWLAYWTALIVIGLDDLAFLFNMVVTKITPFNAGTIGATILWVIAVIIIPFGLPRSRGSKSDGSKPTHKVPFFFQSGLALNSFQKALIFFGLASHVIFIGTIKHYLATGEWGAPKIGWIIPDRIFDIHGLIVHADTLITAHAITVYLLLALMLAQFGMMVYSKRSSKIIHAHRIIGTTAFCFALPVFCLFAGLLTAYSIQTPFNKALFGILPVLIFYAMCKGVYEMRRGNLLLHADAMFLAFTLLNAGPIYRVAAGILIFATNEPFSTSVTKDPNDGGAIMRTVIVLIMLIVSYYSSGRLRQNIFPIAVLLGALVLSLLFLPWAFDGAPM